MSLQIQVLPNGYPFVVGHPYSVAESSAAKVTVAIASIELICSFGLLAVILLSALNSRTSDDPRLFVRTHSAIFFMMLVFCTILQAIGGIMTSAWVTDLGVYKGSVCTAQAVIKHVSDVGIAIWSLIIALYSFYTLWRRREFATSEHAPHTILGFTISHGVFFKWATVITAWLILGIIVILGPEITSNKENGDFYGVSGEWCWITDGYIPERVVFAYLVMIISAVFSLALYAGVFYHNRKKLRMEKPGSEYIISDEDRVDEYAIKLSKYMIWYPLTYFVCIIPLVILRFVYWAGVSIPFGATVFTDVIYHLLGIANAVLFFCAPRLLPGLTIFPAGFITSNYAASREESYKNPQHKEGKQFVPDRRPPPLQIAPPLDPERADVTSENPFATPSTDSPSMTKGSSLDRLKSKYAKKTVRSSGLVLQPGTQNSPKNSPGVKLPPSGKSLSRNSVLSVSTTSSMEKDLASPPRQRGPGLPSRPSVGTPSSSRSSTPNPRMDVNPFADQRAGTTRQFAGLPSHPANSLRTRASDSLPAPRTIARGRRLTAVESLPTADMSTATASLGMRTALGSSIGKSAKTARGRHTAVPHSAMSSSSPLTGARFEMVTQTGVYVAGEEVISEENEE